MFINNFLFKIINWQRFLIIKFLLKKSEYKNYLYANVQFTGLKNITLGNKNTFCKYVQINAISSNKDTYINIGNGNHIASGAVIYAQTGNINIGDNNFIGPRVQIQGFGEVEIGNHCMIAANTFISSSNHNIDNPFSDDYLKNEIGKKVTIENKVWIGANCVITAGTHIKSFSVVAAGSVVTKNVDSYCMVAGVPAKIIKRYNQQTNKWIKVNN